MVTGSPQPSAKRPVPVEQRGRDPILRQALSLHGPRGRRRLLALCGLGAGSLALAALAPLLQDAGNDAQWAALLGTIAAQWLLLVGLTAALVGVRMGGHRRSGRLDDMILTAIPTARIFRSTMLAAAAPSVACAAVLLPAGLVMSALLGEFFGYLSYVMVAVVHGGVAMNVAALSGLVGWRRACTALREAWVWLAISLVPGIPCIVPPILVFGERVLTVSGVACFVFVVPSAVVAWLVAADALRRHGDEWPLPEEEERWWVGPLARWQKAHRLRRLQRDLLALRAREADADPSAGAIESEIDRVMSESLGRTVGRAVAGRTDKIVTELANALARGDRVAAESATERLCSTVSGIVGNWWEVARMSTPR